MTRAKELVTARGARLGVGAGEGARGGRDWREVLEQREGVVHGPRPLPHLHMDVALQVKWQIKRG